MPFNLRAMLLSLGHENYSPVDTNEKFVRRSLNILHHSITFSCSFSARVDNAVSKSTHFRYFALGLI